MSFTFGNTNTSQTSAPFSFGNFGGFGNQTNTQTQPNLQQNANYQNVDFRTVFESLPEALQQQYEQFDSIKRQNRRELADLVDNKPTSTNLDTIKKDLTKLERKYASVLYNLKRDIDAVGKISNQVKEEAQNIESIQTNFGKIRSTHFLGDMNYRSMYFHRVAKNLDSRMQELWHQIEELGATLSRNELERMNSPVLQETLKSQQELLLSISAQVATLHEQANDLRENFQKFFTSSYNLNHIFEASKPTSATTEEDIFSTDRIKKMLGNGSRLTIKQNIIIPGMQPENTQQPQPAQNNPSQPVQSGFSFGTQNNNNNNNTSGFNFGTQNNNTSSSSGFNFGTSTTPSTTTTAPSTSGFSFGTPSTNNTSTTTASTSTGGFNFGAQPTTTGTTPSGGFSFGTTATTPTAANTAPPVTSTQPFGFGGFGTTATATTPVSNLDSGRSEHSAPNLSNPPTKRRNVK
ncbi:hypothetical protein AKO1_001022 [Acrasis kona]|uniref:Nucleoporin p58/p45 n=1 Tax=Acrasis kona TaxID=1008807 RepID=A0AAW2YUE9_9EUKA